MAQAAQTRVPMDNLNLLSNDNIAEDWEEGEDGWESCLAEDDEEWHVVDLEAIGEVSHAGSSFVRVCDNDNLVATIDEFRG